MMNFLKNKRNIIILLTLTLTFGWMFLAFAADPGSDKDPLISLSYFENNLPASLTYFDKNGTAKVNIIYNEFKSL